MRGGEGREGDSPLELKRQIRNWNKKKKRLFFLTFHGLAALKNCWGKGPQDRKTLFPRFPGLDGQKNLSVILVSEWRGEITLRTNRLLYSTSGFQFPTNESG
ncbi:hypothetical protein TNCV_924971 [Trichonephila clavipes]|nr:hypothetical protein TNCV_924971 [Trichonephila clavipes]